jgi:hypothetical protein
MYRRQGGRPWTGAQQRFAWRCLPVVALAPLAAGGWACWSLTAHSLTHWHVASWIAFLILGVLHVVWYERKLLALVDED